MATKKDSVGSSSAARRLCGLPDPACEHESAAECKVGWRGGLLFLFHETYAICSSGMKSCNFNPPMAFLVFLLAAQIGHIFAYSRLHLSHWRGGLLAHHQHTPEYETPFDPHMTFRYERGCAKKTSGKGCVGCLPRSLKWVSGFRASHSPRGGHRGHEPRLEVRLGRRESHRRGVAAARFWLPTTERPHRFAI